MPGIRVRPDAPPPGKTLGWGIYAWMINNLVHGITGEPLELNDESLHYLLCLYHLTDQGGFVYDRAAMRRARGTGKSPLAGNVGNAELAGPVRFGGWELRDEYGNLLGVPARAPNVQILATTLEQTKPIFDISASAWSEEAIERYGLEIGKEFITKAAWPPGRLGRVANNPRGLRGPRPTCVLGDEMSEWVETNGGHAGMIRIRSNLAKDPTASARLMTFANAFNPGEDSEAERDYAAFNDQMERTGQSSILYDSLEAEPHLKLYDLAELREAITQASGDSDLNVDRLIVTAMDPDISPATFRREHLNQILADEDSLISAQLFDEQSKDVMPLGPEDVVTLGFDGSLTGDGTAVVAFRLSDRSFHLLHYWEPDPMDKEWRIDEEAVDEAFRAEITNRPVWACGVDVHPFESWAYAWERDFGSQMKAKISSAGYLIRDNRTDLRNLTFAIQSLVNEIESKSIKFFPSARARAHWGNAKRRPNTYGYSFGKETRNSKKRVDIVAASNMAYIAALALAKNPVEAAPTPGRVVQLKP